MKRLLSNKGNLLFTTAMCLVVAMLGFSLLSLIVATKERTNNYSASLYDRYTKESYGRIAVQEMLNQIVTAESTVHFSPLEDSKDTQLHLQEVLISAYLTESNAWKYGILLPATVTTKRVELTLTIENLNTLLVSDLNLQHTQVLELPPVQASVQMEGYSYSVTIDGLRLVYTFSSNKVHCRYNTDNVVLLNVILTRSERRAHA